MKARHVRKIQKTREMYSILKVFLLCRPQCALSAVNMAYRGQQGLVTASSEAILLFYCNTAIQSCGTCFLVDGPPLSTVEVLQSSDDPTGKRFTVHVNWQSSYQGIVSVSTDQTR